ncbi:MAG TPA: excinuclease ABC subunit UvrC [Chitinophagales bacterium]|nr:excinuclease ABC subunit UvrC [Chitinophagales bacterium]HNE45389.1 excinuclease ABC subunit UvrC [Chitinophagales bacterium]HNF69211.1 excinuclease ABC subunit UvrC [Chitinophagales bacterium]HNI53933.1 excinuclease ABC subunit UvrC [Chitinophagales bacterium]HNJ87854.1 excinuclease ABC subunit UvrC [Chitinophagales bacterium]
MDLDAFKQIEINIPGNPGVYRYYDKEGTLLYVGKAKNLKKRVSSYFQKTDHTARIKLMVKKIAKIEFTIVNNEADAFLLENTLIKKHQPRYNVNLKDGKTYPYIVVKNERFPRIFLTRQKRQDGATYLGPYTSVGKVKTVFDFIKSVFPIRTCNFHLSEQNIQAKKFKVCLEYHLGNCKGPCEGLMQEADYNENVQQIMHILKGNVGSVKVAFKKQMQQYVEQLQFEQAELMRKKLESVEAFQGRSTVVNTSISNVDVFGYTDAESFAVIGYMKIMQGMVTQATTLVLTRKLDETPEELLQIAVMELRLQFESDTPEIIVPFQIEWIDEKLVQTVPQAGDKKKLLELAFKNAMYVREEKEAGKQKREDRNQNTRVLEAIKADFKLTQLPYHIECFDNSNIQGTNPVASMVCFKNAKPSKKDYRHFNIKTVEGPNDFASMHEIVHRRYKRLIEEAIPLPQLIVIDGGKGQLGAAVDALKELGIYGQVAICSIAKRLEEIYFPEDPLPLYINKKSESLRVIQQLRDEAHRFAITFHRQKRSKSAIKSELDDIKGIGRATASNLLKAFKSVKNIRNASIEALSEVVGQAKAQIIIDHFHTTGESSEA